MHICIHCNCFLGDEIFCPCCESIGVTNDHTVYPSSQIINEKIVLYSFKESVYIKAPTEIIKSRCALPVNIHFYSQIQEHLVRKGIYYTHSSISIGE